MNMRQSRIPIVAVLGAVVALLFIIACGTDPTSTPVPTKAPATPAAAETVVPSEPAQPPAQASAPPPIPTGIALIPTVTLVTPTPVPLVMAKPEGTLTLAVPSMAGASGIPFSNGQPGQTYTHFSQEQLINRGLDHSLTGRIAESWSLDVDSGAVRWNLRKGVQFHDGYGELTAADIQWSMESVGQVGSASWRWDAFTPITRFEIPDPHTLITHLPLQDFFLLMDSVYQSKNLGINVTSKAFHEQATEEEAFNHYVGTGPWDHQETVQGEFMRFKAVEDHYQKPPAFAILEVREMPEAGVRLAAIRTGEADITRVSGVFVGEATKAGLKLSPGSGGACNWLQLGGLVLPDRSTFNPNTSPDGIPWVGDPASADSMERALKVRKALNLAVNYKDITDTIYEGLAYSCAAPGYYQDHSWARAEWEDYGYDPGLAQQLLTEAGYGDGFDLRLTINPANPADALAAEAVAQWWEDNLGLDVTRNPEEAIITRARTTGDREFGSKIPEAWTSGSGARTEPWQALSVFTSGTDSLRGAEDAFIDELFPRIAVAFDEAERRNLSTELLEYVHDNYLGVWMVVEPPVFALSNEVENYVNHFGGDYNHIEDVAKAK